MPHSPYIVLLRNELRLNDCPALFHAAQNAAVIPVFVLDDGYNYGAASRYWLHHSLKALSRDFAARGVNLILRRGDSVQILDEIIAQSGAKAIYCTRNYSAHDVMLERKLHDKYENTAIHFRRFGGNLLLEPEKLRNKQGNSFQIFTPFFKELQQSLLRTPLPCPENMRGFAGIPSDNLEDWDLLPTKPNWAKGFDEFWQIGEAAAHDKLAHFLAHKINSYADGRDYPVRAATSYLSPHLRFGEISPAQIWARVQLEIMGALSGGAPSGNYQKFLTELGWREFSYHLLLSHPDMANRPLKGQYAAIEWDNNPQYLRAWQKGQTGFPIVDAGMAELWRTGYMHNRVRMIAASFLIKDLLIDWREGEKWFWDCLIDADDANNPASWQWVAGCGMDAAPYFRIFNPTTQSEKFDPEGEYIKRWLPQLGKLPAKYIHDPAGAPPEVLRAAGVALGKNYPLPIISHKLARTRTLEAYGKIKAP